MIKVMPADSSILDNNAVYIISKNKKKTNTNSIKYQGTEPNNVIKKKKTSKEKRKKKKKK